MTQVHDIPDFLRMTTSSFNGELCRKDLADLRTCIRHREGVQIDQFPSYEGLWRLIGSGMLERRDGKYFSTAHGIQVARANASCADGSESRDRPPAYRRGLKEGVPTDDLVGDVPFTAFLAVDDDEISDGDILFYRLLDSAMSDDDTPTPPPEDAPTPASPQARS
jgi:hypothetical protein